ncbi:hypothetical protein F5X99DRAFT_416915 [Biscogniauxia marginata]|nr:hypothetical protein F5X99DRAFT_416915 [Biscogniauxia marginata]
MFVRPSSHQSLLLPRIATLHRPHLATRHGSVPPSYIRKLVTRPELLPWRRRATQNPHGSTTQRPLATAVGDMIHQDEVSFDPLRPRIPGQYANPLHRLQPYELRSFDPSAPLLVKGHEDPLPRGRMTPNGVPGGVEEMLSVFEACLQVGKLERAALVLQRFGSVGAMPGYDLIVLHNKYLRAAIDKAFEQPDSNWAQSLHKWYEVNIRSKDIPQTPETIAYMLKVSILSAQGARLKRLVNRYMDMLSEEESMYQVLSEVDILSQQDFGIISSIYRPSSGLFDGWDSLTEDLDATTSYSTESQTPEDKRQSTPEVLAVPQKGLGLSTLRGVLSFFKGLEGQDLSKLSYSDRREVQSRLEQDCVDAAINRWREENRALMKMGRNSALSTNSLNPQLYEWQHTMEAKIKNELELCEEAEKRDGKTNEDMDRCLYAPFLTQSTPPRLAAVTIMSVLNAIASTGADRGIHLTQLINSLSKAVEDDVRYQKRQQEQASKKNEWLKKRQEQRQEQRLAQQSRNAQGDTGSPAVEQPTHAHTESNIVEAPRFENKYWPILIKTKLGVALLTIMIDSAKVKVIREHPETKALVSQVQPALTHTAIYRKGRKVGVVMPNKFLVDLMKREPRADFLARHLPMLVEPEPWTGFDKGGFIEFPSQLVRIKHGERDQKIYAEAALRRGDMEQVSKGLDVLGRTPWKINQPVFDVMLEVWNSGEALANIPPLHPQIPIPVEPEKSEDPTKKREWLKRVKAAENEKSGLHSERCFMNFQLEIARAFKDQTFYFPHNMDFRGRAYPIPTYLNHMGADHVRGLLRFGTGRELGENGIRWLKVHLANVFGYDKASLGEREAFATDHTADIFDSANHPLTGKRWWLEAEDPWQCLAACFELKAALESPEPTKYVSYLPVHQDGTCNGLQHYAALGGDVWGAQQVNLVPGDRPADVYTAVADLVKESIAEDMKTDNFLARAVDGKITRKVVKQTVMTNVYGVTFVGARAQVLKQLDALYPKLKDETDIPVPVLASYIATKIFKALSHMFRGAHDIQYWLGECAGRVCRAITPEQLNRLTAENPEDNKEKSKKPKRSIDELLSEFRSTIVWTTPLRMPVVQPYRKNGTRVIHTSMQDLTLQIPERSDPVNRRKQLQAFPPNFIHSLDASHMLLSALECDDLGLSFAAVHDSFWTHAADVDVMNRVLRDSFIRIHSEDVIKRLASEFKARYKGSLYLATIPRGSETEKTISSFRKRQGFTMKEELFEEHKRTQLLLSSDPKEVRKGREMVTPASLFEAASNSSVMSSYDEIAEVGLGNIPDEDARTQLESAGEDDEDSVSHSEPDGVDVPRSGDVERVKELMGMTDFAARISGTEIKKPSAPKKREIHIWLPLTFPDIPKKGGFDVASLKNSLYFFS